MGELSTAEAVTGAIALAVLAINTPWSWLWSKAKSLLPTPGQSPAPAEDGKAVLALIEHFNFLLLHMREAGEEEALAALEEKVGPAVGRLAINLGLYDEGGR